MLHLHIKRGALIGFLAIAFAIAAAHYSPMTPHRSMEIEKRLWAMHGKRGQPSAPEANNPESGANNEAPPPPMPQPAGPGSEAPLFTVDVEAIPEGYTARGTSFPLGHGLWLTARHFANEDCGRIIMIINGNNVDAQIKYLDPNADLAVLQTMGVPAPPLPIESVEPSEDESAYAFGFPKGVLGATADQLMGRARMRLGGRLMGTAPVLAWSELDRFPEDLESLSGISGGPMLDENGNVIGIIVAASTRRGRNYTVAPEILHAVETELGITGPQPDQMPARDAVEQPVSLKFSANAMRQNDRIAETYCIPK
jgi:serine protease Do